MVRRIIALLVVSVAMLALASPAYAWSSISAYEPSGYATCSGEPYFGYEYTAAASPIYEVGSILRIHYRGSFVDVVTNDCTPYWSTFDISMPAAYAIGLAPNVGRCYYPDCWVEVVGYSPYGYY